MEIVNVIVTGETSYCLNGIINIYAYVVEDPQLRSEVAEQAEAKFTSIVMGLGVDEDEISDYLEDGVYEGEDSVNVHMVWSTPINL